MKKFTPFLFVVFVLLALVWPASLALAQDPVVTVEPEPPIIIEPPVWRMEGLEIPYQRVDVTIEDQVATTHIEQLFHNPNEWMLEGTYFFPLPPGAAVSQLTMWVNGEPIEAKILEKEEAREIYDEIVRQLRDPALLEYVGTDAIQANVFPIPPKDERLVEIEYTTLLPAENGLIHYRYPQTADLYTNAPLGEQSIRVEVTSKEPIRTIYSPSHKVAVSRDGEFKAVVGYEDTSVRPEQDFELFYTISPEAIGLNLLTYKEPGEDGFFLILVTPGIETADTVVAKDVLLVLDTSGSMDGEKLAQAQQAANYVVEHLNAGDRFNIVSFNTGTYLYEPELVPAQQPGDFEQFINSLEAVGGTNISEALLEAAALVDRERPATIIFLTDGLATEGINDTLLLLEAVEAQMPGNARVFAFGVGNDVDTMLLDTLAQNHRGATTYVRPDQAIDEAVSGFYAKVGSPVLTDISLDTGDVRASQIYPAQLPDLFAGSQLVLAGRYRDGGAETITLRGSVNGEEQVFRFEDQRFMEEGGQPFIPRLWATRAIGHMMQEIRLHGEDDELVQSIVNLSTRYGIITPYTSFLIEEDDIFAQLDDSFVLEETAEMLAAPTRVSGAQAVDRAAMESEMAAAEAPMEVVVTRVVTETVVEEVEGFAAADESKFQSEPLVVNAGGKTFFQRQGILVDSSFDPDAGEPQIIPFASDAYFDLLGEYPESGQYLALAEEVLVVLGGQAYRVTVNGEQLPVDSGQAAVDSEQSAVDSEQLPLNSGEAAGNSENEASPEPAQEPASALPVCGAALVMPLLVVGLMGMNLTRRRKM